MAGRGLPLTRFAPLPWLQELPKPLTKLVWDGALGISAALLAALIAWYVAYFQYLVIYTGNIPTEMAWYLRRSHGEWRVMAWVLAAMAGLGMVWGAAFAMLLLTGGAIPPRGGNGGMP